MESFPSLLVVSQPKVERYPANLDTMDMVMVVEKETGDFSDILHGFRRDTYKMKD